MGGISKILITVITIATTICLTIIQLRTAVERRKKRIASSAADKGIKKQTRTCSYSLSVRRTAKNYGSTLAVSNFSKINFSKTTDSRCWRSSVAAGVHPRSSTFLWDRIVASVRLGRTQSRAVVAAAILFTQPFSIAAPASRIDFHEMARVLTNTSADHVERENALHKAGEIGTNGYPLLTALITVVSRKTNQYERELATAVIGGIGRRANPAAVPLASIFGDKTEVASLRMKAVRAVGFIGAEANQAVPGLILLLDSTNAHPSLQLEAVVALKRIGPVARQSIPHLVNLLSSHESELVSAAAKTLGDFTHHAKAALEPLSRKIAHSTVDIGVFPDLVSAFLQIYEKTWLSPDRTSSDLLLLDNCGRTVEGRLQDLAYPEFKEATHRLTSLNSKVRAEINNWRSTQLNPWWTRAPWFVCVAIFYYCLWFSIIRPLLLKRKPLWIYLANVGLKKFPEIPVPGISGVTIGLRRALGFESLYGHPRVLAAWVERHRRTLKRHIHLHPDLTQWTERGMRLLKKDSVVRALFSHPQPQALAEALGSAVLKGKDIPIVLSPRQLAPETGEGLFPTLREEMRVIADIQDDEKWLPQDFLKILLRQKRVVIILASCDGSWSRIEKLVQSGEISSVNALVITCRDLPQEANWCKMFDHTDSESHEHEDKYVNQSQ